MALKGMKVVEMAGLAPAPFCGTVLSDFGARVIRVDKLQSSSDQDQLSRGKESIAVDLKQADGRDIIRKLCLTADVIVEPFRQGIMERLGLGPEILMKENKRLIYARLTGYGQIGCLSARAGHDINYLATSGVLSTLGRKGDNPYFPLNILADFAGGGFMCAFGIVMALLERAKSGQGQIIDANMVQGAAYISKWLWASGDMFIWNNERGDNLLDGGSACYEVYKTSDDLFMAVGSLEPQFFNKLIIGLGLNPDEVNQFGEQEELKKLFSEIFASKTQSEWTEIFGDIDACCTPILTKHEATQHPHNITNKTFLTDSSGLMEPGPAPRLSRTPGINSLRPRATCGLNTVDVLRELGYSEADINDLIKKEIIEQCSTINSKL